MKNNISYNRVADFEKRGKIEPNIIKILEESYAQKSL
jgi:hypothetical protein